jgi:NAD(P)-dependent dehydrogenase (short-subunit alcohol dehydrogenase family)
MPSPQAAYARSKTATSLFAVEATRRWAADGIVANAVNPGGVATGIATALHPKAEGLPGRSRGGVFADKKTARQGADKTAGRAPSPLLSQRLPLNSPAPAAII